MGSHFQIYLHSVLKLSFLRLVSLFCKELKVCCLVFFRDIRKKVSKLGLLFLGQMQFHHFFMFFFFI